MRSWPPAGRTIPNQVNNVLGFPFIFRGALDVRATQINDEMKLAATRALAALAKEDVPDSVRARLRRGAAWSSAASTSFPSRSTPRAHLGSRRRWRRPPWRPASRSCRSILGEYREQLERRLGKAHEFMRVMVHKAQRHPKRVVFPEGEKTRSCAPARSCSTRRSPHPILLGDESAIRRKLEELRSAPERHRDHRSTARLACEALHRGTFRAAPAQGHDPSGIRRAGAESRQLFGALMVELGHADGADRRPDQALPRCDPPGAADHWIRQGSRRVAGRYAHDHAARRIYLLADATVNIEPTAEDLAEIAMLTAEMARRFNVEPRVAMLSFSNFGSNAAPARPRKWRKPWRSSSAGAGPDGRRRDAGRHRGDAGDLEQTYPFSTLKGSANVLIFPEPGGGQHRLQAAGEARAAPKLIGPIIMGLAKPMHVLQRGAEVNDIVNMASIAVVDAQELAKAGSPEPHEAITVA